MSPQELRLGSYQVRQQPSPLPWSRWRVATRVSDNQMGFLRQLVTAQINQRIRTQLIAHLRVSADQLQPLEIETLGEQTLVFSAIEPGRLLSEQCGPGVSLAPSQVCKLGIVVAQSLAAMHRNSVVHGAVRADRVWVTKSGQLMLLRDPAIELSNQGRTGDDDWLDTGEAPHDYAAPEFAAANQPCDIVTDLYSLGCLLFRTLTGRAPIDATSWDQAVSEHARTSPPLLVSAVAQRGSGDPLLRVIAFAMAKSPEVRFDSADQLAAALRATLPLTRDVAEKLPTAVELGPAVAVDSGRLIDRRTPAVVTKKERRRQRKRPRQALIAAGVSAAAVLLLIGFGIRRWGQSASQRQTSDAVVQRSSQSPPAQPSDPLQPGQSIVDQQTLTRGYRLVKDDQTLYVPPYRLDSPSVSLALLPPGPAVIASIRTAFLFAAADHESLANAFEAELSELMDRLSSRTGVSPESIERCTIAIHPKQPADVETSLAIELRSPESIVSLAEKLQVSSSRTAAGSTIYVSDEGSGEAYFFSPIEGDEERVSKFAIGSIDRVSEVADLDGGEILLPPGLQSLWKYASEEADFAVLATPNFLFADGRTLLLSSMPEAVEPLRAFLIPDVSAGLLVVGTEGQRLYGELRLLPSGGSNDALLMKKLSDAAAELPLWADQFVIDSQPAPTWRLLATRLPLMIRFVVRYARFGTSDGSAVVNLYLPERIVPQLCLAFSLAINTPAGRTATVANPAVADTLTLDQLLDRKMSISFDQESLEFAVETVLSEFRQRLPAGVKMPPIRIVGGDLQKMGITQNQQIRGFAKTDVSLRAVLTDLVVQANPDRTANGPSDPKQALVWVVADDPQQPAGKSILVTTRQASAGKYELPSEFRAKIENWLGNRLSTVFRRKRDRGPAALRIVPGRNLARGADRTARLAPCRWVRLEELFGGIADCHMENPLALAAQGDGTASGVLVLQVCTRNHHSAQQPSEFMQVADYVPISVATLLPTEAVGLDLFQQEQDSDRVVLYRGAEYPLSLNDLDRLRSRGIHRLYITKESRSIYQTYLRSIATKGDAESIPFTARVGALAEVVRDVLESTFKYQEVDQTVTAAEKLGGLATDIITNDQFAAGDLFRVLHHDYATFSHSTNVAFYCGILAEELGYSKSEIKQITTGGLLHDLGKLEIEEAILCKQGKLDDFEFRRIQAHPITGFRKLAHRKDLVAGQLMMAYQHHERIDGRGYPVGCLGSEIHPWAKLCAVVDVFEALTSHRPYRKPMPRSKALVLQQRDSGTHFDPEILACWKTIIHRDLVS